MILYLPRGPFALEKTREPCNLSSLGFDANASVVRVNYRASAKHKFPTPLHDVLAAYDWILTHFLPQANIEDAGSDQVDPVSIGVCGELFGGTLATVLALTECHIGRRGIRAAAVGNLITDWTAMHAVPNGGSSDLHKEEDDLEPTVKKKRASRKASVKDSWAAFSANTTISSASLLRARFALFAKPEHYFDPFASPLLFFRTASSDIPPEGRFEDLFFDDLALLEFIKKRRAHRRHPPLGSDLVLPPMRVQIGEENLLRDQSRELVESVRKSVGSGSKEPVEVGRLRGSSAMGEERVEVVRSTGLGLWTENDWTDMGMWFGRVLRPA